MVTRKEAELEALKLAGVDKRSIVLMTKFSPVPYAEELMKQNRIIYDKHKILWRYDKEEGLWMMGAEQFIRTSLRTKLMGEEQQKKNYVEEVLSYIKDVTHDEKFEMDKNPYLIPFKNKVYDLKKGEFFDFHEEMYLTNKLDLEYDSEVTECPAIDKFFSESIGEEHKIILYELLAYCLFRDIPYQKIFFIFGPAGTGKSKFMNLIEKVLGENTCCVEPKTIVKEKHATTAMLNKYANVVSDISYDDLKDINQLKKLSGEDSITIRRMYQEPYSTKLYLKQIYTTNKLPAVAEKTMAWYRRLYLIEFGNIVKQEERDSFLLEKLTTEQELKGLCYKLLENLKDLHKHNFIFTWDINEQEVGRVYEELSNPLLLFIRENFVEGHGEYIFKWEFSEQVEAWLKNNHFPSMARSQINKWMKEKYNESNRESFNGGKPHRVWTGLRAKTSVEQPSFNHFNHFNQETKRVYIYRRCFENYSKSVKSVKLAVNEGEVNT